MLVFARELREVSAARTVRFEVVMTRDDDASSRSKGAWQLAHEAGADIFISLHADAIDEGIARGAAIYTLAEEASDAASAAPGRDGMIATTCWPGSISAGRTTVWRTC